MNVLVVDDEEDIRDVFEDEHYTVSVAMNGAEAMAKLAQLAGACVVILDLRMPIMGGNEVYQAMLRDERLAATPVVVTTSDPSSAPSGVLVMRKPLHLERLIETVKGMAHQISQR